MCKEEPPGSVVWVGIGLGIFVVNSVIASPVEDGACCKVKSVSLEVSKNGLKMQFRY